MGIDALHAHKNRDGQPEKRLQRLVPESREQQVEPHHIGLELADLLHELHRVGKAVEVPGADDLEIRKLGLLFDCRLELVRKNRQTQQRVDLEFFRNVIAVFAEPSTARWKRGYQTDLHEVPGYWNQNSVSRMTGKNFVVGPVPVKLRKDS